MNRTIKFRAWDKKYGKMCDLTLLGLHCSFDANPAVYGVWSAERTEKVAHYSDVELMQFTGLFDEDGTEIYEGDILEDDADGLSYDVVEWNDKYAGWTTRSWYAPKDLADSAKLHRVAGNIYENPELLKV